MPNSLQTSFRRLADAAEFPGIPQLTPPRRTRGYSQILKYRDKTARFDRCGLRLFCYRIENGSLKT
jgi:hypothetical protein